MNVMLDFCVVCIFLLSFEMQKVVHRSQAAVVFIEILHLPFVSRTQMVWIEMKFPKIYI